MSLFGKRETITLYSEQQKDEYIEKLDRAHIVYDLREKTEGSFDNRIFYVIRVKADDLKKVI